MNPQTLQTVDHLVSSAGLLSDLAGAIILAWGLLVSPDQAVQLRGQSGLSFCSDGRGATREQMLQQTAVKDLLKQARYARLGFVLLAAGFVLQLVGTWLPEWLTVSGCR